MTAEARPRGSWLLGESMVGRTSGELVVIEQAERPADASKNIHGTWWLCRCSCGNERIVPRNWIISQHTKSCGCLKRGRKKGTKIKQTEQKIRKIRKAKEESEKVKAQIATSCELLAYECVCPFCGKTFERLSNAWAYKITIGSRLYWLCSWRCLYKVKYEKQGLRVVEV